MKAIEALEKFKEITTELVQNETTDWKVVKKQFNVEEYEAIRSALVELDEIKKRAEEINSTIRCEALAQHYIASSFNGINDAKIRNDAELNLKRLERRMNDIDYILKGESK